MNSNLKISPYNFSPYRTTAYKKKNISFKNTESIKAEKIKPAIISRHFSIYGSEPIPVLQYEKPVKLSQALQDIIAEEKLNIGVVGEKNTIKNFLNNLPQEVKDTKVVGINGYGTIALAFDTVDEKILKITNGNHFPMNRPIQAFDVPTYQKGHQNGVFYYIQEKLYQHSLPQHFTQIIKDRIKQAGFKPVDLEDWASHQIGLSKEGKLYLIDSECAKYKTIFHAIYDKTKNLIKQATPIITYFSNRA